MVEKKLNTRIQLKGDSYQNWTEKNPVLLSNEVAIVTIAEKDGAPVNKPGVYFKVGDGVSKFSDLEFTSGIAGDVYQWAKAESKPVYTATEIKGLGEFISGEIQDTNTKYQIVQDIENPRKFTLQSKEIGEESWTEVTVVTIPETAYTLVEGTANGTVKFNGTDVPVHGLKSAAYQESSTFDAAGAADAAKIAIIGTDSDVSTADTIKGTKKYVDEQIAAIPKVEVAEYTIAKASTPTSGAFATYELKKDGVAVGAKIDIPKDYLVKSATIKTAGESDPSNFPVGTKYIDFVVNSVEGLGNESHIYLNVNELVDAYTAGNGIIVSDSNEISVNVVAENGLSVDATGIKLSVATASTPGAMSAADKAKLDGLHAIATSGNVNDLVQTEGDVLILNCGNATL